MPAQSNPVRRELRALIADRLVWWAFRLDPERFVKNGGFLVDLHKLNDVPQSLTCDCDGRSNAYISRHDQRYHCWDCDRLIPEGRL